jgi:hypothetical protein
VRPGGDGGVACSDTRGGTWLWTAAVRLASCRTAAVGFGHGSGSAGAFMAWVRHAAVLARRGAWHARWRQRADERARCREREKLTGGPPQQILF